MDLNQVAAVAGIVSAVAALAALRPMVVRVRRPDRAAVARMPSDKNRFSSISLNASKGQIFGFGSRLFQQQRENDSRGPSFYDDAEHFNVAVHFIAKEAWQRKFPALAGMTADQIAKEIGDDISRYGDGERRGGRSYE
jgi:hypothetical protein